MRFLFPRFVSGGGAVALLVLRLATGAAFILHGWPKIQNATHWMGDSAPVPDYMQALAAGSEFGGGIALILGLLTPLACVMIGGVMATAIGMVHLKAGHPYVAAHGGPSWELAAVYLAVVLTLLLVGPGKLSVDALLFGRKASAE